MVATSMNADVQQVRFFFNMVVNRISNPGKWPTRATYVRTTIIHQFVRKCKEHLVLILIPMDSLHTSTDRYVELPCKVRCQLPVPGYQRGAACTSRWLLLLLFEDTLPTCRRVNFGEGAAVPLCTTDQVMDGGFTRYCTWYTAAHVGQIRISTVLQQ